MINRELKRTELKEKRTASRKVYENQDHSRTVEIYMDPIHYRDKDGSWKEMDDTLELLEGDAVAAELVGTVNVEETPSMSNAGFRNRKGDLEILLSESTAFKKTAAISYDKTSLTCGRRRHDPLLLL